MKLTSLLLAAVTSATVALTVPAHADPLMGTFSDHDMLTPYSQVTYDPILLGVGTTLLTVVGQTAGADIDCKVYDSNGNYVVGDTSEKNGCSIVLTVPRISYAYIQIQNASNLFATYNLTLN